MRRIREALESKGRTWNVWGKVVGTKYLGTFKASNAEEAILKAEKDCYVSLCSQCADECEDADISDFIVEEVFK